MSLIKLWGLPYLVHTNRELGLMLRGVKPLSYFFYAVGEESERVIRYLRLFDRRAQAGLLVRREIVEPLPHPTKDWLTGRKLLYAFPGQEWRIDAMLALVALRGAWTEERERRFGELLGYEDWQNDAWMAGPGRRWRDRGGSS